MNGWFWFFVDESHRYVLEG